MKYSEFSKIEKTEVKTSGETTPATMKVEKGVVTLTWKIEDMEVRTSKKNPNYHFVTLVLDEVIPPLSRRSYNIPL